jgi:hypothetical protein
MCNIVQHFLLIRAGAVKVVAPCLEEAAPVAVPVLEAVAEDI